MCSYARCCFFEGRARVQILPKMAEKSRHQPVFFLRTAKRLRVDTHPPRELISACAAVLKILVGDPRSRGYF